MIPLGIDHTEDHIWITRHNRAVEAIGRVTEMVLFVENHGEENSVHSSFDQVDDMPADQLGRVTQVFRHDVSSPFLE